MIIRILKDLNINISWNMIFIGLCTGDVEAYEVIDYAMEQIELGDCRSEIFELAGAYAARIASVGKLFQQKNDSGVVISKTVSADGVSVSKSFAELPANSTALLEPDLQLAIALLKPYGLSRSQVRVVRGG